MMDPASKRRVKAMVVQELLGKLPIGDGTYRVTAAEVNDPKGKDNYALMKVHGPQGLEMYLEVKVKEVY